MALKKGLLAIRAKWLWDWLERGTIQVVPLLGTSATGALVVVQDARPFKTCHQQEDGEAVKKAMRYWLGEGTLLVRRWDPLSIHYDPIADAQIATMGLDELKERGMYSLKDGTMLVLIYQHIEDALHFQRQQWHIRLEAYAAELQEISALLAGIEERALAGISEEIRGEELGTLGILDSRYRHRREKIHTILTHLASRERAAEILIDTLRYELQLTQKSLQGVFTSKPMEDLLNDVPTSVEGLRAYLVRIYRNLNQLRVRPIVRPLKLAQHYLRVALGALDVNEPLSLKHQLELALENLDKALFSLEHPKEKIAKLLPTAA